MEMDVNDLLHRQQMAMLRAQRSRSTKGRMAYQGLAREYSDRIDAYRLKNVMRVPAG